MTDNLSPESRRRAMSAVKSSGTTPEWTVRRLLHQAGFRYRLHHPELPGKPDLVLVRHRLVILVHGCYWHGHSCARGNRLPKTNAAYWRAKISGNAARDKQQLRELRQLGWNVLVIWECQTRRLDFAQWLVGRVLRMTKPQR